MADESPASKPHANAHADIAAAVAAQQAAQQINLSPLEDAKAAFDDDDREVLIDIRDVSMAFNTATQRLNSLKEYVIALARHDLHFAEFRALDHINLQVKKGDVFGILGTNGSGKSTLLKIIAGVLEPTEGSVEIRGNIAPLIELGAGFDYELTARENVYLNGALLGYSKKFITQHFDEIVEFAEVTPFMDMPLKNFSSGMVARIAFAIATVIVPEILIVDEVLAVGDFMFQQKCEQRIQRLIREYGVTVLIVSHDTNQIERLCNKAIWIEKGHTRIMGTAEEVCKVYRVLGGHGGTRESEAKVLDCLKQEVDIPENAVEVIAGETAAETIAIIARRVYANRPVKTAVVAPVETMIYAEAAQSLCAAYDAPLLLSKNEMLAQSTARALKDFDPEQVFVIGSDFTISADVFDHICAAAPHAHVSRVEGHTTVEIGYGIYDLGRAQGALNTWGDTAIVAADWCESDLIDVSPMIYDRPLPIFFGGANAKFDDGMLPRLMEAGIKHLVLMGTADQYKNSSEKPFQRAGIDLRRLNGTDELNVAPIIQGYLDEVRAAEGKSNPDTLIVCSAVSRTDALGAGMLAHALDASVAFIDASNLNSVAWTMDYLEKCKGSVRKLIFLGGDMCFSQLDRDTLAKAMVLAQQRQTPAE